MVPVGDAGVFGSINFLTVSAGQRRITSQKQITKNQHKTKIL
jgi:hypothetical protein